MKIRKAIIPAGGLGTRFLPATKAQPKEMLPIVDRPTIQYIVEEAVNSGIEQIVIILGNNKDSIKNHFSRSAELEMELERKGEQELLQLAKSFSDSVKINYITQDQPKGLGHAVYCAKETIGNESFAVMLGDDVVHSEIPCLRQLIDIYDRYHSTVLGVKLVADEDIPKYGIIGTQQLEDRLFKVTELFEKPSIELAPSNIAILGRYILTPYIFECIERTAPGRGGEIQLTDALKSILDVEDIYGFQFIGDSYDVGNKLGFLKATVEFALRRHDINKEFQDYLKSIVESFNTNNISLV